MTRHEVTQIMHGLTDPFCSYSDDRKIAGLIDVVNAILPLVKFPEDEEPLDTIDGMVIDGVHYRSVEHGTCKQCEGNERSALCNAFCENAVSPALCCHVKV